MECKGPDGHSREFLTGIVEGFYGRAWSTETRIAYADYLSHAGMNTCLYCPKEDVYLRKQWHHVGLMSSGGTCSR